MKINQQTETMLAQAVALSQNGRMKSTVHLGGNSLYIKNMDDTIFLKFKINQKIDQEFSFFANDYESPDVEIEDGKVVFNMVSGNYTRKKVCAAPNFTFKNAKELWDSIVELDSKILLIENTVAELLDDSLSHIEFSKISGQPMKIVQRDIYTGSRVEITKKVTSGGMGSLLDELDESDGFDTIGLRTADFKALYTFFDSLNWQFSEENHFVRISDQKGIIQGIISTCLYDEMPYLAETKGVKNGR